MSRSRLYPYKDDIAEAMAAGTSMRALARTYGVAQGTMRYFVSRWLGIGDSHKCTLARGRARFADDPGIRERKNARARERYASDSDVRLRKCQYDSLRYARKRVEEAESRIMEVY